MSETEWKYRLIFFIRAADATTENKQKVADYLANNGSMETSANELKMFDNVQKFSLSGSLPAQAFGFNLPVKPAMRDAIGNFIQTLTNPKWAVIANTKLVNAEDHELLATNFDLEPSGQIVTWENALAYLENELGLKWIPPVVEGV